MVLHFDSIKPSYINYTSNTSNNYIDDDIITKYIDYASI